jgi:outer membrane protein assembly factor BamB
LIFKYLLDDKIQGSPSVGRGVVLAGTNSGKLYCFSSSIGFTLIPDKSIITIFQGEKPNFKLKFY